MNLKSALRSYRWSFKGISKKFKGSRMFQRWFKRFTNVLKGCFKNVPSKFPDCFREVSTVCQKCFKDFFRNFLGIFKVVVIEFHGSLAFL